MPALSLRARERWFAAITFAAFLFAVGTPAVQSFTAAKYQTGAGQQAVPLSALALRVSKLSPLIICGLCLAVLVLFVRQLPRTGIPALVVLLLPWAYLVVRDEYLGTSPHVYSFCYPLICTAVWCLRPRLTALRPLGYLVGVTAVVSIAMGWLTPLKGIYQSVSGTEISPDKNIFSSGILVGPLSSGNNLGQFLVMGTAAILLIPHRRLRAVLLVASVYAQLWAASRSCLAALAVLLVVAVAWHLLRSGTRALMIGMTLVSMTVLLVALPFVTTDPVSFSNRGYVWQVSRGAWGADRIFGLGSNFYARIAATSATFGTSVFHGHNQLMQDLVTGGWVLAVLMGVVFAVAIAAAVRLAFRGEPFPGLFLIGLIGASLLEVSYVLVDRFFALPVMVLPLACLLFTTTANPQRDDPPTDPLQEHPDVPAAGAEPVTAGAVHRADHAETSDHAVATDPSPGRTSPRGLSNARMLPMGRRGGWRPGNAVPRVAGRRGGRSVEKRR